MGTDIGKDRLDMEHDVRQSKKTKHCQKRCMHDVYNTARHLYLESIASCIGLGAELLQVRNGMNCKHDVKLDNTIL